MDHYQNNCMRKEAVEGGCLGQQRSEREAPRFRARLTVAKEKGKRKISSGKEGGGVGRREERRCKCKKWGRGKQEKVSTSTGLLALEAQ